MAEAQILWRSEQLLQDSNEEPILPGLVRGGDKEGFAEGITFEPGQKTVGFKELDRQTACAKTIIRRRIGSIQRYEGGWCGWRSGDQGGWQASHIQLRMPSIDVSCAFLQSIMHILGMK